MNSIHSILHERQMESQLQRGVSLTETLSSKRRAQWNLLWKKEQSCVDCVSHHSSSCAPCRCKRRTTEKRKSGRQRSCSAPSQILLSSSWPTGWRWEPLFYIHRHSALVQLTCANLSFVSINLCLQIRGTLKSWTKLWCVLKPGVLLIYKTHKNGQWVGTVLLNACELIERPSKKDGFCFKLFHPLEQSIWAVKVRKYSCSSETHQKSEVVKWMG